MSESQTTNDGETSEYEDDNSSIKLSVVENTSTSKEGNDIIFWKYSCVFTGVLLFLLVLLIVIVSLVLFLELKSSGRESPDGESYTFVGMKDGELTFDGGVFIDNIFLIEPFQNSVFGSESEDGRESVIIFQNSDDILFEVTSDLRCCPSRRSDVGSCGDIITSEKTVFPGKTESQVRRNMLKKYEEKKVGFMEIQLCNRGEQITRFISKISEKLEHFHCHAQCEGSTLSTFLHYNPTAVELVLKKMMVSYENFMKTHVGDEEVQVPSEEDAKLDIKTSILDPSDQGCRHLNVHADSKEPKLKEDMGIEFADVCDLVCSSPQFRTDSLEGSPIFDHVCQINSYSVECRAESCWDPDFHEGVDSAEYGGTKFRKTDELKIDRR